MKQMTTYQCATVSSLNWSFSCFLCCFCSTGVCSEYTINVYNMNFGPLTYSENSGIFCLVKSTRMTNGDYYVLLRASVNLYKLRLQLFPRKILNLVQFSVIKKTILKCGGTWFYNYFYFGILFLGLL